LINLHLAYPQLAGFAIKFKDIMSEIDGRAEKDSPWNRCFLLVYS